MYQALYRKYRPKTFDEVVGQTSVTQTLKTQLITGKLSHAYLFTGSRGTGKTSCAKILAKAVNCLDPQDGNPCNCCAACQAIESGSCMDVLEIDAASNNGVDNVRSLRDDAIYAPAEVKKRVYIIDEVHMLSISAFNALLKIIEEPPEHLLFILATTELHKVPATILSRCQRFSFRRLTAKDIAGRINYAAYEEGIDLDPEAALLLSRLADGALRDGMSLLDQCATASAGKVTLQSVYDCLGLAGAKNAARMLALTAEKNTRAALELLDDQYAAGKDLSAMLGELLSLCRDLLILKTAPNAGPGMLTGVCTDEEIRTLLPHFTPAELLRLTKLLQDTSAGFQKSANRRIDAELCIMQMCDPALSLDAASLSARLAKVEQAVASGVLPAPAVQTPPPVQAEQPAAVKQAPAPKPAAPAEPQEEALPMNFWADFTAQVRAQVQPSARGFFTPTENGTLHPMLQGSTLLLQTGYPLVHQILDDPAMLQLLGRIASGLLGRPLQVRLVRREQAGSREKLEQLLQFGREHRDIVTIEKNT